MVCAWAKRLVVPVLHWKGVRADLDAAPAPRPEEAAEDEEQQNDDDQQNEHVTRFLSMFHPGAGLSLTTQMTHAAASSAVGCAFYSCFRSTQRQTCTAAIRRSGLGISCGKEHG